MTESPTNNASIEYDEEHYYKYSNKNNDSPGYEIFNTAHLSLPQRLVACLRNECMTDVCLVGEYDGLPVPACRFLLGAASPVFQPLLYGNLGSSEGNASTVTIRESNQTSLQALVEFSASDELNTSIWAKSTPEDTLKDNVLLSRLAAMYEMPKLQREVATFLRPLLNTYPSLSCLVLNLTDQETTPDIYQMALTLVREHPYVALDSNNSAKKSNKQNSTKEGGMQSLTAENLERVLRDDTVEADELFLFRQLLAWKRYNQHRYKNVKAICQHVVKNIDLTAMDPEELEGIVMPSGFVDDSVLVQVLMQQARAARKSGADAVVTFSSLRGKRGKKYVNVMVENAGDHECNGIYVYFESQNEGIQDNVLYFIKKKASVGDASTSNPASEKNKTFVLVKDSIDTWRICDNYKNILYERPKTNGNSPSDEFPSTGWTRVKGVDPAPTCKPSKGFPEVCDNQSSKGEGLDQKDSGKVNTVGQPGGTIQDTNPEKSVSHGHEASSAAVKTETSDTGTDTLTSSSKNTSFKTASSKLTKKTSTSCKAEAKQKKKATRKMSLMDDDDDEPDPAASTVEKDTCAIQEVTLNRSDPLLGKEVGGNGFSADKEDLNKILKHGLVATMAATKDQVEVATANAQCGMVPQDESILPGCSYTKYQ